MNQFMKRFLIRSVILSLILLIAGWILYTQIIPQHYSNVLPFILILLFLTTNLIHAYLLRIAEKNISKFTTQFMAMSSLKMLLYLVIIIGYIWIGRAQAETVCINFFVAYIGFTIMEVTEISRVVRLKK